MSWNKKAKSIAQVQKGYIVASKKWVFSASRFANDRLKNKYFMHIYKMRLFKTWNGCYIL